MKIQEIRGTHDLFGQQLLRFKRLEKIVNNIKVVDTGILSLVRINKNIGAAICKK